MKIPRRRFLRLAAGAAVLGVTPRIAMAQSYPARSVRIIVGFPAGAGADIAARLVGQSLSEQFAQSFIVENRPGAGGNVGADVIARAAADGYTLLLVNSSNAINATLYNRLNFNLLDSIAPIATVFSGPFVMVVNPSFPANSVAEFIRYAKAHPGEINMASAGVGSAPHLAGELFKMSAGINMVHVPYRGIAPALTDLLGGQVQVMFASMPSSIEYIKDGKLRPLAVTSANRWDALPDVPPVSDFLPGFEASAWFAVGAPKNTPAEVIDRLNKAINVGLADSKMKARLTHLGGAVLAGSPADCGKLIADETEKWGKVIKGSNIKLE
jgi:tripartite-type tricarboxylate transporter receptor subunit TctC